METNIDTKVQPELNEAGQKEVADNEARKLTGIPKEALQAELDKRLETERREAIPKPLPNPDFSNLVASCKEHVGGFAEKGYANKDDEYFIYEYAMKAIFGEDVFAWINDCPKTNFKNGCQVSDGDFDTIAKVPK
jgi:hypothetical protein